MKKKHVRRKYHVVIAACMAAISFIAVLTWHNTVKASYTVENDCGSSSWPGNDKYTYIEVKGPSGTSRLTLKVTHSGSAYKNYTFDDASRTLTVTKVSVSDPNPYDLSLAETSARTTQSSTGQYSWMDIKVKYTVPAHEQYRSVTYDAPSSGANKLTNTPGHSLTVQKDYITTVGMSAYNTGVAPYRDPATQRYSRRYNCTTTIGLEKNKYTVTYKGNGGTVDTASKDFYCGDTLTFPTATRTGYTLDGWNEKADGSGASYTTNTTICGGELTAYAEWKANSYQIHYDANGGTGTMNDSSVTYNEKFRFPKNTFRKNGYTFLGWSKNQGSDVADYDDQEEITYKTATDQTLYAVWGNGQYKISYDPNGGQGDLKAMTVKTGETTALEKNSYVRKGYTFLGWNTDENASGAAYRDGQKVTDLTDAGNTVKLYAVWRKSDGSFNTSNIIHDEDMFTGDINIQGGNGTGYDSGHTDSGYARIDQGDTPGYFTKR